jgi:2,3-bisphosphoglycerate-independent phosphoglycerate mutase
MKILYLIMDGLGDRPCECLGGRTPLEAAATPCLDELARKGMTGLMHLLAPGIPVGTDVGHICLFGYDPADIYTGRGPIEAVGVGCDMKPGELAFRGNFATVNEKGEVIDKRAGRIRERTAELAEALTMDLGDGVSVRVKEATEHRAAVIFSGPGLSIDLTNAYPSSLRPLPQAFPWVKARSPEAKAFAEKVNLFMRRAQEIMAALPVNAERIARGEKPANAMLLRGPGFMPFVPRFEERFPGLKVGLVVAQETVLALGKMMGMTIACAPGMTGGMATDMQAKAREALRLLKDHDLVFVHVKGPDLAGHDQLPETKKKLIEQADAMMASILSGWNEPLIVAAGADHSTPCAFGEHSGDPVPVLLSGPGLRVDGTSEYSESGAILGGIGHISGKDFLNVVLDAAYLVPKQGS